MQLELESDYEPCNNSHEMKGEIEIEPVVKICRDSIVKEGACNVISFGVNYNFIFDGLILSAVFRPSNATWRIELCPADNRRSLLAPRRAPAHHITT